jgi:hypothetical protein
MHEIEFPVLFLERTEDNAYRRSDGWLGYQIMKSHGLNAKYVEVDGGDHGLSNRPEQRDAHVVAYLQEHGCIAT